MLSIFTGIRGWAELRTSFFVFTDELKIIFFLIDSYAGNDEKTLRCLFF